MRVHGSKVHWSTSGVFLVCTAAAIACGAEPPAEWVRLAEDSDGQPTYIDAANIRMGDDSVAVYRRVVGDPLAAGRVEFLQSLDCGHLRWAFLTLDETLLDSIAGTNLSTEAWSLLALTPANRRLVDEVCEGISPNRWIRVFRAETDQPGDLKEVWVDRESLEGPGRDSVRTEFEELGVAEEVFRSWSRWLDASPDSGYLMIEADVACDLGTLRYLENSRYSPSGELVRQAETTDLWFPMYRNSLEEQVFGVVCDMEEFFRAGAASEAPAGVTPGTSP